MHILMPHMQIVSIAKCELSSNKLHELKLAKCVNVNSNEKKRGLKGNIAFYKQRMYVFNGNGVGIIPGVKLLLLRSICGIIYMKKKSQFMYRVSRRYMCHKVLGAPTVREIEHEIHSGCKCKHNLSCE